MTSRPIGFSNCIFFDMNAFAFWMMIKESFHIKVDSLFQYFDVAVWGNALLNLLETVVIEVEQFLENGGGISNLSGVCEGGEDSLTSGQYVKNSGSNFEVFS